MPTTVRLDDKVKREFDRLQGDYLAENGQRLSHSELLARLLRFARMHEDELFSQTPPARTTPEQLKAWRARLPNVRIDARARDVDEALYGDGA